MRNFDLLDVYFDKQGNPLHGKVLFTERATTGGSLPSLKNVYDSNGNAIANPVYTGLDGRLSKQVFLGDGDYSVWMYQYVGDGTMETDDNLENFELVDTFIVSNVYEDIQLVLDNSKVFCVDSIAALRSLDPALVSGSVKVVLVKGYSAAGDKKPVFYKSSLSGTDNGGSIIQSSSDTSVRWVLLDGGKYVDVRDFGVFPDKGDDTLIGQIVNAIAYANTSGKDILFPRGGYKFNGGNINIVGSLLVNDGVSFTGKNGTSTSISCKNVNGGNASLSLNSEGTGSIALTSDTARTSWMNGTCSVNARYELHIDKDVAIGNGTIGSPSKVYVDVPCTMQKYFKDCEIVCNGKLSSNGIYTFVNTNFTDKFFVDNVVGNVALSGVVLNANEFANVGTLIQRKGGIVDLQGVDCGNLSLPNMSPFTLVNGKIGTLTLTKTGSTAGNITLVNCDIGSIVCSSDWDSITLKGCNVLNESTIVPKAIVAKGCSFGADADIGTDDDAVLNATLDDCEILCDIIAETIAMTGCKCAGKVTMAAACEDDTISAYISRNDFMADGGIYLDMGGTKTAALAIVGNSFSTNANGFTWSSSAELSTRAISMRYEGNTGNVLQRKVALHSVTDISTQYAGGSAVAFSSAKEYPLMILGSTKVKVFASVFAQLSGGSSQVSFLNLGFAGEYTPTYKGKFSIPKNGSGYLLDKDGNTMLCSVENLSSSTIFSRSDTSITIEAE